LDPSTEYTLELNADHICDVRDEIRDTTDFMK